MSTIVYQQVSQSSSLSLKFSNPSKLVFSSSTYTTPSSSNNDKNGGWGAIEALSNTTPKEEKECHDVYVHPFAKRSLFTKSFLSDKSLEMCTESLGSETGAFFPESSLYFSTTNTTTTSTDNSSNNSSSNYEKKPWKTSYKSAYEFPPPLTTISGANSIQVRPYREDGRLVIEAVSAPSNNSCLRVERSNGRLKMTLVTEDNLNDNDYDNDENEEVEAEAETSFDMEGSVGIIDIDEQEEGEEKREVKVEEEEEEEEEEYGGVNLGEDMDGIRLMFGGKMGKGDQDFQRPRRCNEGGRGNIKRFINWEPCWVAT